MSIGSSLSIKLKPNVTRKCNKKSLTSYCLLRLVMMIRIVKSPLMWITLTTWRKSYLTQKSNTLLKSLKNNSKRSLRSFKNSNWSFSMNSKITQMRRYKLTRFWTPSKIIHLSKTSAKRLLLLSIRWLLILNWLSRKLQSWNTVKLITTRRYLSFSELWASMNPSKCCSTFPPPHRSSRVCKRVGSSISMLQETQYTSLIRLIGLQIILHFKVIRDRIPRIVNIGLKQLVVALREFRNKRRQGMIFLKMGNISILMKKWKLSLHYNSSIRITHLISSKKFQRPWSTYL